VEVNGKKKNTPKAYEAKIQEFCSYCDFFYKNHPLESRYTVMKDKVEAFMAYYLYREHKPRGKRKTGGGASLLEYEKANEIITTYAGAK